MRDLLRVAARGPAAFGALIAERGSRLERQAFRQLLQSDAIAMQLHELQDFKPEGKSPMRGKSLSGRSSASGGTASSSPSFASVNSGAFHLNLGKHQARVPVALQGRFLDLLQKVTYSEESDDIEESEVTVGFVRASATCRAP